MEARAEVWISLQTDSKRAAVEKAPAVWSAQLAGNSDDASEQFEAAQKLASAQGLRYLPLEEVINLPIEPLLERIESISNRPEVTLITQNVDDLLERAGASDVIHMHGELIKTCLLSSILEAHSIPRRFYLSAKACAGIVRRAERRGKQLPPSLRDALEAVALRRAAMKG